MTIEIRSEQIADYHRIAEINALAFYPYVARPLVSTYLPEFALVDALRHSANYDPELSLVAAVDGHVVGHAFFYPFQIWVGGGELRAVSLGPIAVDPPFQKKGIGGQLIHEGHRRAQEKGYAFVFLLGHDSYYPRFGYITHMFGECRLDVDRRSIPQVKAGLEEKLVQPDDLALLVKIWKDWFADVDLSIFPGTSVLDWLTHSEEIMSSVVAQDDEIIGYVRYTKNDPANVKLFMARDRPSVELLLSYLSNKIADQGVASIKLPLHPESRVAREYLALPYEVTLKTWSAAMIKILDPDNQAISEYCRQVSSGKRKPGLFIYPPCIEFA